MHRGDDISSTPREASPPRGGGSRVSRLLARAPWRRVSRYTAGSAICFGVSEVTFVLLFEPHLLGARGASIAASIAGIIPGYWLNRSWTWGRRGRSDLWREVVPYWAVALFSTVAAALATGAVNDAFASYSREARTIINAAAYMATYGVLFIAKYVLFDRVLFTGRRAPAAVTPAGENDPAVTPAGGNDPAVRAATFE